MTLRRHVWLASLLLPLLAHAAPAYGASTAAAPGDPPAGSPSGSVYQLPFEQGRSDAAPKGTGGTSAEIAPGSGRGGGGGGNGPEGSQPAGGEGSYYRSENDFGSASKVPGAPASGGAATAGGGTGGGSTGSGGGGEGGGNDALDATQTAAHVPDSGNTSTATNVALLLLILVIAGGVAFFGLRANRLRAQQ